MHRPYRPQPSSASHWQWQAGLDTRHWHSTILHSYRNAKRRAWRLAGSSLRMTRPSLEPGTATGTRTTRPSTSRLSRRTLRSTSSSDRHHRCLSGAALEVNTTFHRDVSLIPSQVSRCQSVCVSWMFYVLMFSTDTSQPVAISSYLSNMGMRDIVSRLSMSI